MDKSDMAGERRGQERAERPKLSTTNWKTPAAREGYTQEPEQISSESQSEDDSDDDISPTTSQRPGLPRDGLAESNATTPTPLLHQTVAGMNSISLDVLSQIRKAVREEVGEAMQKSFLNEYITQSLQSSASGSNASSTAPSPAANSSFPRSAESAVTVANASKPSVRFSDRRTFSKRPAGNSRSNSQTEPVAEWGTLFDSDGYATSRCHQFLGGIAKHIIEEYTPKNSLVIVPEKLGAFYTKYRLDTEVFPFADIFRWSSSDAQERPADFFTDCFVDLECQHHLVQKDTKSRPRIPALTPSGFATYMKMCILAYPEEEFRRLEKIVAEIPITVESEGRSERLPRQLLRSQLPARPDSNLRKLFNGALEDLMYDLKLPSSGGNRSPVLRPSGPDKRGSVSSSRSNRRRFVPGTLQTIGDERAREKGSRGEPDKGPSLYDPRSNQTLPHLPLTQVDQVTPVDLHLPPDRSARPRASGGSNRSGSFSQPVAAGIPPPPVGRNSVSSLPYVPSCLPPPPVPVTSASSSSRRARSPPPSLRSYNSSAADGIGNGSSPSSSNVAFTPSTYSSASVSPPLEHGGGGYRGDGAEPRKSVDDTRAAAMAELEQSAQWSRAGPMPGMVGSGGMSQGMTPTANSAASVAASVAAGGASNMAGPPANTMPVNHERRQRHRRSMVVPGEDLGPTWEEVLKSQRGNPRNSIHGSGYSANY